ncbi:hypothetical protein QAD02_004935 [Eretmocerus hayati]|uniref:Uncharacterized protein n=1 Tax=Eretmocerus hayati TaxID=131215 RepID=A0ACC2NR52_9HYME|nr:hypothetical protein QAD02_004935 [Eretmocerus hayati]
MYVNQYRRQWLILITLCIGEIGNSLCISLQSPLYPREAREKGVSASEYSLVFGIFQLVNFIISPIYGKNISRIGPKRLLMIGTFSTGTNVILFGLLDKIEGHYAFFVASLIIRVIEGLSSAAYFTTTAAILPTVMPQGASMAFAILRVSFGVGFIVGPALGGFLYELGGYSLPFLVMGLNLYVSGVVVFFLIDTDSSLKGRAICDGSYKELFKSRGVVITIASLVTASLNIGFLQSILEPHLKQFGLRPFHVGLVFIIGGTLYSASAPMWGWICKCRMGSKIVAVIGILLHILAFTFIGPAPFIPCETMLWLVGIGLVLYGLGNGAQLVASYPNALNYAISSGCPDNIETHGLISGLWASSFALGSFIGPSIAGFLFDNVGMRNACLFIIGINSVLILVVIVYLFLFDDTDERYQRLSAIDESTHLLSTNSIGTVYAGNIRTAAPTDYLKDTAFEVSNKVSTT